MFSVAKTCVILRLFNNEKLWFEEERKLMIKQWLHLNERMHVYKVTIQISMTIVENVTFKKINNELKRH